MYRWQRNICNNINKQCKASFFANRLNEIDNSDKSDHADDECYSDVMTDIVDDCNSDAFNGDALNNDSYSDRKMWQCVKEITNIHKQNHPRILNINGDFTVLYGTVLYCTVL